MKSPCRLCGLSPGRPLSGLIALLGVGSVMLLGRAPAEQVDAELILLVDTSIVVSGQNFDDLLDGYASAFESSAVIAALQAGSQGRIAASVIFFSGAGVQTVGVPWMSISSAATSQAFAAAIRAAANPPSTIFSSFSGGLDFAPQQFGTETGNISNGFESPAKSPSP